MTCRLTMALISESQEGNIGNDWRYELEAKVFHGALAGGAKVEVPKHQLESGAVRLPFGAPTDPVLQARMAAARAAGLDPFASVQLPAAAITLKQGVGRLIRTHTDRGIVALLDGRITRRAYGATLLDALPPIPRLQQPADLVAWWRRSG